MIITQPSSVYIHLTGATNGLCFSSAGKTVIISNQPYFYKKAELFPGSAFVIGADTAARLISVRESILIASYFLALYFISGALVNVAVNCSVSSFLVCYLATFLTDKYMRYFYEGSSLFSKDFCHLMKLT